METRRLAAVASFTALALGTDYALSLFPNLPNVKLVDPIVFSVAFVYGFETGVYVGVLSELVWGTVNPLGFGGYIIPFLVAGEVLFAVAGWAASRLWSARGPQTPARNFCFGCLLAICAFLWDLETNAATAIVVFWPSLTMRKVIATELVGVPFMVPHEVSDLVTGALLVPFIIYYASRFSSVTPSAADVT
jgi:hypothetical protein